MKTYDIKDINGNVRFIARDAMEAFGFYAYVKKETGYAEVWYNGKCLLKTK